MFRNCFSASLTCNIMEGTSEIALSHSMGCNCTMQVWGDSVCDISAVFYEWSLGWLKIEMREQNGWVTPPWWTCICCFLNNYFGQFFSWDQFCSQDYLWLHTSSAPWHWLYIGTFFWRHRLLTSAVTLKWIELNVHIAFLTIILFFASLKQ